METACRRCLYGFQVETYSGVCINYRKPQDFNSPECPAGTSRPKISYPGRLLTGLMYEARIEGNGIACANPRCRQSLIKGEKVKPSLRLTSEALFPKKAI